MNLKDLHLDGALQKVEELSKKIGADKPLLESFTKNPVKTLEEKFGVNLPDEQVHKLVDAIKAKLNLEKAGNLLGNVEKLFK